MNLVRLAPKVFVIGSAIGGASGIAPIVKVGQSGSSVLTQEEVKRMHFYPPRQTGVCFGFDEFSGKVARADQDQNSVRLVFWLQHGNQGGCAKFTGGNAGKQVKSDMERNGYYRVTLKKDEWAQLIKTIANNKSQFENKLKVVGEVLIKGTEDGKVKTILERIQERISKQQIEQRGNSVKIDIQKDMQVYEQLLTLVVVGIRKGPLGQWTWMRGRGVQS